MILLIQRCITPLSTRRLIENVGENVGEEVLLTKNDKTVVIVRPKVLCYK